MHRAPTPTPTAPTTRRRTGWIRALTLAALIACGEEPAGIPRGDPAPGVLAARLISPHDAEGAVLVELDGAAVSSVTATGATVLTRREAGALYVLVARLTPGEIRFELAVPDTTRPPDARIVQVADGANRLRADIGSYSLELRP